MTEVKILLSGNRYIMTSLNNEKVSNDHIGVTPFLAAFANLAAFKDGHHFKEGQLENGLPIMGFFAAPLDYTCKYFFRTIWGKGSRPNAPVAILWLNLSSQNVTCQSYITEITIFNLILNFQPSLSANPNGDLASFNEWQA